MNKWDIFFYDVNNGSTPAIPCKSSIKTKLSKAMNKDLPPQKMNIPLRLAPYIRGAVVMKSFRFKDGTYLQMVADSSCTTIWPSPATLEAQLFDKFPPAFSGL